MTLQESDLLELDDGSMALELKAAELEVTVDELSRMLGLPL
tara:strand:- start:426 stop:548 length:123 start_codon:yes stop_codon:yes gene_type:complete